MVGTGPPGRPEGVARRAVVQAGDLHHLANGPKLRDRRAEGDGGLAKVSPESDEGAHGVCTLADPLLSIGW